MPFNGQGLQGLYVEDAFSPSGSGDVEALTVEERSFVVAAADLSDGEEGIRVTLGWMDPPATAFSSTQLVHDLDLFVEAPDGTVWTM